MLHLAKAVGLIVFVTYLQSALSSTASEQGELIHRLTRNVIHDKLLSKKQGPNAVSVEGKLSLTPGKILSRRKRWDFRTYTVTEEQSNPPTYVSTLHSSFDNYTNSVMYSITGPGAGSLFTIEPISGRLYAQTKLDRESKSSYHFMVRAKDLEGREVEPPSNITINVVDVNDNDPKFPPGVKFATVEERSPIGTVVMDIKAYDLDDPTQPYGQLRYSIINGTGRGKFAIHQETGQVRTSAILDREQADNYTLIIQVRDSPNARLFFSDTTMLTVAVIDVNDNPPMFVNLPYTASVREDADIGSRVMDVSIQDADLGLNRRSTYSIVDGKDSDKFRVATVGNKGVIKVNKRLDYETAPNDHHYHFRVKVVNTDLNPNYHGSMEDEAKVVVRVTDVDEPPEFDKQLYEFTVKENAIVGFPIEAVKAADPEGDSFTYYMEDPSGKFVIGPSSGMISVAASLDRESSPKYEVTVKAGRPGRIAAISKAKVVIHLADINDHPPQPVEGDELNFDFCDNHHSPVQEAHPKLRMTDLDAEKNGAPFRFYFPKRNNDFKIVSNGDDSGSLFTTRKYYNVKKYQLPIVVEDSGKPRLNASYIITVRFCHCGDNGTPACNVMTSVGGIKLEVLIFLLLACLILLVLVIALLAVRRRRRHRAEALLKGSASSLDDDEVRENIIHYDEEGGGEEDTNAYDLSALQRDYCSSSSGSQVKSRHPSPPSTKVSLLPPYDQATPRRRPVPSQDIREFVNDRKSEEDNDDTKLAFDSLQIYAYEGAGSEAGSLSSLCTSSVESAQDYDHLSDWGPRFQRLADMYGAGKPEYPESGSTPASENLMRSTLSRQATPC